MTPTMQAIAQMAQKENDRAAMGAEGRKLDDLRSITKDDTYPDWLDSWGITPYADAAYVMAALTTRFGGPGVQSNRRKYEERLRKYGFLKEEEQC